MQQYATLSCTPAFMLAGMLLIVYSAIAAVEPQPICSRAHQGLRVRTRS